MSARIVRLVMPLVLLLCLAILLGCAGRERETARIDGFIYVSAARPAGAAFALWVFPERLPPGQAKKRGLVPLAGIVVKVMGTDLVAVSDAHGYFVLVGVPLGKHSLLFIITDMRPVVWILSVPTGRPLHANYHAFVHPAGPRAGEPKGRHRHRGRGRALLESEALSEFVRAHEAEPYSGEVLAALVSGTDVSKGATTVSVAHEAWSYAQQEETERAARLCDEWNRVVLRAREEAGYEDKATVTTRVCDSSGNVLLSRSTQ